MVIVGDGRRRIFWKKICKKKGKDFGEYFFNNVEKRNRRLGGKIAFQEEKFHHTVIKNDDIAQKIFFQLFWKG